MKFLKAEVNEIILLSKEFPELVQCRNLGTITQGTQEYPIYGLVIGSKDKTHPTLGLFGGVHGLEKIGSDVVLSFINTLRNRLSWDNDLIEELKTSRIVCIPMVNPWGIIHFHRSNGNGVDLMRNAPIDAEGSPTFLVGGHRIGSFLPWYRGKKDAPMEKESQILIDFVEKEMFEAKVSIALDIHSGFGLKDQIWYPFAKSKKPFNFLDQFKKLSRLFIDSYPYHVYKIEPQSYHYTTHGDLWDYALLKHEEHSNHSSTFIPITLELGSWAWVKKNPLQIFSSRGLFNPVKAHRYGRTMRRHIYLIDFLFRAIRNDEKWNTK